MRIGRFVQTATLTGAVFMMAASLSASSIMFNTNAAGTKFSGDGLTLDSTQGAAATLTFSPDGNTLVGVPTNINFGSFFLTCLSCSTQVNGAGAFFPDFVFDLIITDLSDNATGEFVGTSSGHTVFSDVSQLTISWVPLLLGPGTNNALTGNFGTTIFDITASTRIVSPNSGEIPGQTTVQGDVTTSGAPEPATIALIGASLLGLCALRRKRRSLR
jgi:hypothetical protein